MLTKTTTKTTNYDVKGGFYIDVVETENEYGAWMYHKDYDIKALMFYEDKATYGRDAFMSLVDVSVVGFKDDYRRAVILMGED